MIREYIYEPTKGPKISSVRFYVNEENINVALVVEDEKYACSVVVPLPEDGSGVDWGTYAKDMDLTMAENQAVSLVKLSKESYDALCRAQDEKENSEEISPKTLAS